MADLFVDVDTAIVVPMNDMPLVDDTDFKTLETALVYNSAGIKVYWHFLTTAGVYTIVEIHPTTAGVHDISEPIADIGHYGIEIPASGGDHANNDTEGVGWITGLATGIYHFKGPKILCRAAALNNRDVDNTTDVIADDVAAVHVHAQAIIDDVALVHTHVADCATATGVADLHTDVADIHADVAEILTDTGTAGVVVASASKSGYALTTAPPTVAEIWGYALASAGAETTFGGRIKAFITSLVYAAAPTADANATALLDNALSGHGAAGSVGEILTDLHTDVAANTTAIGDVHATDLPAVKTVVDAIKVMTDKVGTITNTGGTATIGAILGDMANSALVTRVTAVPHDTWAHDLTSGHTTAGTAGAQLNDIDTETDLLKVGGALHVAIDNIEADTNELQAAWADGGRLDLLLDGASAPSAAAVADAICDEALSGHTTAGTVGAVLTNIHDVDIQALYNGMTDATFGLSALHADIGSTLTLVGTVHTDVDTLLNSVGDMHSTDLPDLHTDLVDLHNDIGSLLTNLATLDAIVDDIHDTDLPLVKVDTAAIHTVVDDIHGTDLPGVPGAIRTELTSELGNIADIHTNDLPAVKTKLDALHDFDPAADTVAHVTLVDTTTTNTDALQWLYVPPA
jgi:hypothetical protein